MNHYITPDNKSLGFDDTQTDLIPDGAVLVPNIYTMQQIPYLMLVDGSIVYDQAKYDSDVAAAQANEQAALAAKASAIAKLTALGLTATEITALTGVTL
jgi:hypothetical protein